MVDPRKKYRIHIYDQSIFDSILECKRQQCGMTKKNPVIIVSYKRNPNVYGIGNV